MIALRAKAVHCWAFVNFAYSEDAWAIVKNITDGI